MSSIYFLIIIEVSLVDTRWKTEVFIKKKKHKILEVKTNYT